MFRLRKHPQISCNITDITGKMKNLGRIPRPIELRRNNVKITSVDTSLIKVEGILKYSLSFADHAKSTTLSFNSFIVIRGLANSMNIGKPVLDAIGATWDFSVPNININGQLID